MTYAQQPWVDNVTPVDAAHMLHIEAGIGTVESGLTTAKADKPGYGTTLPGSPVDGQEYVLVDSTTNPSYQWYFRYNAGSTSPYKWEFIGGAPGSNDIATVVSGVINTNYVAIDPGFVVPRTGDYEWRIDCQVGNNTASAATWVAMGPNGVAIDNDGAAGYFPAVTAWSVAVSRGRRATGVAAGTNLEMCGKVSSGQGTFQFRTIKVWPVRVS